MFAKSTSKYICKKKTYYRVKVYIYAIVPLNVRYFIESLQVIESAPK